MKINKESVDIDGYYINENTTFDTLRNISHNLLNFQSRLEYLHVQEYLLVSKEILREDYLENLDNYDYFEYFSSVLLMHINNVTFKTKYEKLYNFLEAPVYRIFNFDYDAYKHVYAPNIKKFVVNLKFLEDEEGTIKFLDDPLLIKTCNKIDFEEVPTEKKIFYIYKKTSTPLIPNFKNILHEAYLGLSLINITKKYLPNFTFTYCYTECSRPNINENKKVINWCNEEKNEYNIFPYIFKENVAGVKYSDYIEYCTDYELNLLLCQYENALTLCDAIFMKYENRGTNENNLIVYKSDKKFKIPLYNKIKKIFNIGGEYETNSYIETDLILYITDFNDVTIEYVSLGAEVTEYNTNTIENKISKNKNYSFDKLLNYTKSIREFEYTKIIGIKGEIEHKLYEPVIEHNFGKFGDDFNEKMILYNDFCYEKKKGYKKEFETTILMKLEKFNKELNRTLDSKEVLMTCEEYILFLIYMKGSTCFNFIHHMDNMYNIMTGLTQKLKEYNYPSYTVNSLEHTMAKCYERLPIHNLFTKSNVISIFNMIKNLVMRICAYRLIYIIAAEIYYNHPDVNLGTKILPLLVPSKEGLGIPISLFKTISSFLVKNVMSKFLENHWTFLLILFIQLYPDIINNTKSLWNKSFEVLENLYTTPQYYSMLEIFSNKLKNQNDEDTWTMMKTDEERVESIEGESQESIEEISLRNNEIPKLNNNKISKVLKYLLSLSAKEYNNVKNKILKGDFSMVSKLIVF